MVAGEDDHIIGIKTVHEVDVLVDGVGGTLVPAGLLVETLVGGQHLSAALRLVQTPGLTIADIFIQLQRLVLGQNTDGVDTGVDTVGQREVDDAVLAAEGNGGLGGFLRQYLKTASLTTGQKHCDDTFFLKVHGYSSLYLDDD